MKYFLLFISTVICSFASLAQTMSAEDAAVFKQLDKAKHNKKAEKKLEDVYKTAKETHLYKIEQLSSADKELQSSTIVNEYAALQDLYKAISASECCKDLAGLTSYTAELQQAKNKAAEIFYDVAEKFSSDTSCAGIRKAKTCFEKADGYVPGYKDAAQRKEQLYRDNLFVVAFNAVEDTFFFSDKGFSQKTYTLVNDALVTRVIDQLDVSKSSIPFLELVKLGDCTSRQLNPDWVVNISLPDLRVQQSTENSTTSEYVSVVVGYDSTGRPIYGRDVEFRTHTVTYISDGSIEAELSVIDVMQDKILIAEKYESSFSNPPAGGEGDYGGSEMRTGAALWLCHRIFLQYLNKLKTLLEL